MEELITRVAQGAGIGEDTARSAVGAVLAFLKKEGPTEQIAKVFENLSGAEALAAEQEGGGGLMGMFSGGVMGLGTKLMGMGLGMDEMKSVGREIIGYAKEKAGEDDMNAIVAAIPGLSQFV